MIASIYSYIFSRGLFRNLNDRIISLALRARGYNNYGSNTKSGESFFIEKILAPTNPKLCIDVGANIGGYSNEILSKTGANVICFEPLPMAYQELKKIVSHNNGRVKCENMGIGNAVGELVIHFNPDALGHASFSEDVKKVSYVTNELQATVPVITLDSYCEDNKITAIDLVKIDTEGFEAEVFEGAVKTFANIKPKFIQIEFNWHQLFRQTSLNYFAEQLKGYEVYQLIPSGWVKRDPRDPLSNIFIFSNFVFVHKNVLEEDC